jgi:carbonyl reductase 1
MSYTRIGAVTGANKGIGLAIVRQLALQYPKSAVNNGALLIYLTARDTGRGEAALKSLHDDVQLKKAKALKGDGGLTDIKFHQLDISDTMSIRGFADFLKKEHGEIDFVVNNAGMYCPVLLEGAIADVV